MKPRVKILATSLVKKKVRITGIDRYALLRQTGPAALSHTRAIDRSMRGCQYHVDVFMLKDTNSRPIRSSRSTSQSGRLFDRWLFKTQHVFCGKNVSARQLTLATGLGGCSFEQIEFFYRNKWLLSIGLYLLCGLGQECWPKAKLTDSALGGSGVTAHS